MRQRITDGLLALAGKYRKPAARRRRYVFIVTYGRSGSTLLQKIIGTIDGYYIAGENNGALFGLIDSYVKIKDAKLTEGTISRNSAGDPWLGIHRVDPRSYGRGISNLFVSEIIKPPPHARVIGFKEVRYLDRLQQLDEDLDVMCEIFSPTLIVFNKRKPQDVAVSGWWKTHEPNRLMAEIERFHGMMDSYVQRHPKRATIVDYDRFTQDVSQLRPLFDRLGEDFDRDRIAAVLRERLEH